MTCLTGSGPAGHVTLQERRHLMPGSIGEAAKILDVCLAA
ncbi:hypothetical protein JYK04_01597 [Streptomyces nojiriensis]|nr:hypothetical protein JYK04_01597 [Streptomyces nojiriensis]